MRAQLSKEGTKEYYLAGFENNTGEGNRFNFIANNGQRTEQKSDHPMQDYMMPETCKQTRKVEVYCCGTVYLEGFKFFDINNTLLFEVGYTSRTMTPVLIAADEQIIGVKAKLYDTYQAIYTDFQFMVCKRV